MAPVKSVVTTVLVRAACDGAVEQIAVLVVTSVFHCAYAFRNTKQTAVSSRFF